MLGISAKGDQYCGSRADVWCIICIPFNVIGARVRCGGLHSSSENDCNGLVDGAGGMETENFEGFEMDVKDRQEGPYSQWWIKFEDAICIP